MCDLGYNKIGVVGLIRRHRAMPVALRPYLDKVVTLKYESHKSSDIASYESSRASENYLGTRG